MGIELPAELGDVAARAGVRWPEADEDKMRESATAWRDAGRRIGTLAGDADGTAQGALRSFDGEAAQAAGREWDGFVADDGVLPVSARQCTAAADRLDHAAEQIGAAKVQMVRELVTLASQTNAAEQAAAAGHPQALAALDPVLQGATANVAKVHDTLASAVDISSGVVMEGASATVSGAAETGHGALETTASTVDKTVDDTAGGAVGKTVDSVVSLAGGGPGKPGDIVAGAGTGVGEGVGSAAGGLAAAPGELGEVTTGAAEGWPGGTEHTGPVTVDPGGQSDGTGPIPVISEGSRSGWAAGGADPASVTAPQSVQAAWANQPAPPPGAVPPPPGAVPPAAFGAPPQPGVGGPQYVAQPGPGQQAPPPVPPPAAAAGGGRPMYQPAARGPVAFGLGQGVPQQGNQPVQRPPMRPVPPPVPQPMPAPPQPEMPQRPLRQGVRNPDAVAFVLHQFPIGYMPVAASRASRQLPTPETQPEGREGLNFPPQDHPESHLVDDTDAVNRARSAEVYRAAEQDRELEHGQDGDHAAAPAGIPAELLADYEQFGEFTEPEWTSRFISGEGDRRGFRWPPARQCPEGGVAPGDPVVLEPDTVLDHIGDGQGRMLYAAGTPFARRSLPVEYSDLAHRRYRVVRRLPVWQAVVAPWFGQPGGGFRYRATYSLADLVGLGYLVELTTARRLAEAATLRIQLPAPGEAETMGETAEPGTPGRGSGDTTEEAVK